MNFIAQTQNVNAITYMLKIFSIILYTYYIELKILNNDKYDKTKLIKMLLEIMVISVFYVSIKMLSNFLLSTIFLIIVISVLMSKRTQNDIGFSFITTIIALSVNYVIFFASVVISFVPNFLLKINNNFIGLIILLIIYSILIFIFLRTKRFNRGFGFLKNNSQNQNLQLLVLNISLIVLFLIVMFQNYDKLKTDFIGYCLIIFSVIMFITIQKCLQLYYKQKLLERDLKETKEELAKKIKEVEELEAENLSISKKSHTLTHKQKSLEYKLQEIMNKTEISTEEAAEARERLKEIEKDLYKEKNTVKLDKTGIPQIDDMLEYMQSECKKNKIDFELQINGNIHYMTNNLIPKEDLETLLADHIKNAIIAINHIDNINRSILVRLGEIDGNYSLYIYDSGIEFEKETLENLGKKPSTTHENEGGTGMGFMNTFDTLRKCEASLTINEFNKPTKDNYTKAIIIKFDKKNEFKVISYR
ncbi:MAG: hypothetical protein IJE68_02920 [Clostridia bacterium]|nr:hypothetical protein [Clostridia bacterium]